MRYYDAETIRKRLDWPRMIAALTAALQSEIQVPVRARHAIPVPGLPDASLLLTLNVMNALVGTLAQAAP